MDQSGQYDCRPVKEWPTRMLQVMVLGDPKGQPRPRAAFIKKLNRVRIYDPGTAEGWKALVMQAVRPYLPKEPISIGTAVSLELLFLMPRPKDHYGTGKNAGKTKVMAPIAHTSKPDLDNLEKAVMDCLSNAGLWHDDNQVAKKTSEKRYVYPDERPGLKLRATWDVFIADGKAD